MKEKNKQIRLKLMINHMKITFRHNKLFTSLKSLSQKWNIDISQQLLQVWECRVMRWNADSIPKHGKIWHQEDSHYMVPHF